MIQGMGSVEVVIYRDHTRYVETCESLEAAIGLAWAVEDAGSGAVESIDGRPREDFRAELDALDDL